MVRKRKTDKTSFIAHTIQYAHQYVKSHFN